MITRPSKKAVLTKKEQSTVVAYKLMSERIRNLEASLKKTQDESERERKEKHELDKKVVLLENSQRINIFLEIFKFIAAGGVGFAVNYATAKNWNLGLVFGIPSIIIYIVCIIANKK